MKTDTSVSLAVLFALTCWASAAFSQELVEATLARLNVLPAAERQAALVKGAQNEKSVEWYATLPLDLSSQLITAFRRRHPFIDVKYTRGGGGRMVNRVVTEHRAGSNKFDVLGGTSTSHEILM